MLKCAFIHLDGMIFASHRAWQNLFSKIRFMALNAAKTIAESLVKKIDEVFM
jgi:hypothetical protein